MTRPIHENRANIIPGKNGNNEDLIATYHSEDVTDIVIMDGGSSVADRNYVDCEAGDVVWIVRNFARSLPAVRLPLLYTGDISTVAVQLRCRHTV
jgi:hypothetical protein